MPHLSLALLGTFQVTLDGRAVTAFESDKVRALLAYLALEADRPHRRESLAALLWPEWPERRAYRNLSQALYNLRQTIGDAIGDSGDERGTRGEPFLLVTPHTLQFDPASDHEVDAAAFAGLLAACDAHDHPRLSACPACLGRLRQAVALYRGAFLAGLSLRDSAAFDEWALFHGERLHRLVLGALGRLTGAHAARGEHERALDYARRWVELDPWQEPAQRQLMHLLALTGRRSAALAQYAACRRALAEELNVEPEAETTALFRRIRDATGAGGAAFRPAHNLPAALTPFVGRRAELAAVTGCLRDPGCRLLTLTGPGGAGKTRLALEAAAAVLDDFPGGVYLVPLSALQTAAAIVPALAEALRFPFREGRAPREQLLDYLREKCLLLLLDNFEHLLGAVDLIVDLLQAAPGVKLLVTSQERLHLQAEHLFPLAGMELPAEGQAEQDAGPAQHDALQLFASGARRCRPDFRLSAGNLRAVARVCRLVHGMPLGILLAAVWVDCFDPEEIAARIARSADFLAQDWRDLPERQRSLRAVFEYAWHLLGDRERDVLQQLSVFRGPFTADAALEVAGAAPADLQALVDRSLLYQLHPGPASRYEAHALVRQYAAERLERTPGAAAAARERHCAYFVAALERWGAALRGHGQAAGLAEIAAAGDNARAAWAWAAGHAQAGALGRALEGLTRFYEWHGRHEEGEVACRQAAEGLAVDVSPGAVLVRVRLLVRRFDFCRLLGRSGEARHVLQACDPLLEAVERAGCDVRSERAAVLLRAGHAALGMDREQARRHYIESLALYRALGERWNTAEALAALGAVAWNQGRYDEARRWHEQALEIRQELGDPGRIANALSSLGFTALYQGRLQDAERLTRQALAMQREAGHRLGTADGLRNLGMTFLALGRFDEARAFLEESLAMFADLGFRYSLEPAMLAAAEMHSGDYAQARAHAEGALSTGLQTGFRRGLGFARMVLGELALAEGDYPEARRLLEQAEETYREIGQWAERAWVLCSLSHAVRGLGAAETAQGLVDQALQAAVEAGAFLPLLAALPAAAWLLLDRGEVQRAGRLYARARRYPFVAASRWFTAVAGRHLEAAARAVATDGQEDGPEQAAAAADLTLLASDLLRTCWDTDSMP